MENVDLSNVKQKQEWETIKNVWHIVFTKINGGICVT